MEFGIERDVLSSVTLYTEVSVLNIASPLYRRMAISLIFLSSSIKLFFSMILKVLAISLSGNLSMKVKTTDLELSMAFSYSSSPIRLTL